VATISQTERLTTINGWPKAVGDAKLESEGNADKLERKVQNAIGGLKDTLKGR
jgi:uncharacterized protein YjbJ (UPF0337 family)